MPLTVGARLGHYSILSAIGAGGMGEVYLAEDERLRRRVALKVLPTHLTADEAAGKRLLREARSAATLQHPNICTVYEVGETDGRGFIAMQYLEGHTLAERLKKGPLELPAAISIGRQIAEAVAEAHRHGIVHRDIKPQNVIVSPENLATVLDFGLAKAVAPAEGSATATMLTEPGVVSGTVSYMSPEQARAETVDERSDVFSFGIVLSEMIAGSHPFAHDNWAETLAAILTRDPRPIEAAIPAELRRILRKCLEKDRARRYQTMKDVALDLEDLAQEMSNAKAAALAISTEAPAVRRRTLRRLWIAGAATLALAAAAAAFGVWMNSSRAPAQGGYEALTDFTDAATAPSLSPDGRMLTFIRGGSWFMTRTGQIYVKMLPNGEAVRLTDDPRPKLAPVFSPDGSRIAYTSVGMEMSGMSWETWTVPVSGGTPTRLLANASGLTWIDARHVLFSEVQPGMTVHMGLVTATEDRRDARKVYLPAHERAMAHYSYLSPDRAWILVVEMGRLGTFDSCRLVPFDGSSDGRQIGPPGVCQAAAWSPDGKWMYFTVEVDGGPSHLWRQRFPDGTPEPLTSGPATDEEGVAVAPDGRSLVTSIGIRQSSLWLHSGDSERGLSSEGYAFLPRLTADARRLYYLLRRGAGSGMTELSVMDLAAQKSERVLPDFSVVDYAVSRDEKEVAVTTTAADRSLEVWVASLDRRTAPRRIVQGADSVAFGANRDLVFRSIQGHLNNVERIGIDGQNRVRLSEINAIGLVRVSPDGRWVTFAGQIERDRSGVIAVPVYGGDPAVVCYNGCRLEWAPDAASLYVGLGLQGPSPVLILPLKPGQVFPEFPPGGGEAVAAWRKLPGARLVDRPDSIPGLDPSTYVLAKTDERRNLFRVPLPR